MGTQSDQYVRLTRIGAGEYIYSPLSVHIEKGRIHAGGSWMTEWRVSRNGTTATFQTLDDVRRWLSGLTQA